MEDGIWMFKPQTIKEALNLGEMRDDQITRQRRFAQPTITRASTIMNNPITTLALIQAAVKRISWEEMQKKRAQGRCFDCNYKFTLGHKCQAPQLMILENLTINDAATSETAEP